MWLEQMSYQCREAKEINDRFFSITSQTQELCSESSVQLEKALCARAQQRLWF